MTQTIRNRIEQISSGQVPEGYKRSSLSVIPLDWQSATLEKLFEFYGGLGLSREKLGETGVPYLHYGDMHRKMFSLVSYDEYINYPKCDIKIKGDENFLLKDGDVVFLDASEDLTGTSRCVVVDNPLNKSFVSGLHTIVAKPKNKLLNKWYKKYFTQTTIVQKQFETLSVGVKVLGINKTTIKKIEIFLPPLPEQQKIAEILGKWDKAIELQERLIEKLEERKKGLMQRLLSSNEKLQSFMLKDVLKETSVRTITNNEYNVLSSTINGVLLQSDYFNKDIASADNTGYKVLKKGQIVFSPQNLWLGNINLNSEFEIGIVSPSYKIFDVAEPHNKTIVITILKSKYMLKKYELASEQGASVVRRNLDLKSFLNIAIKLPNEEEQKEKATILNTANQQINLNQQRLSALKQQKQALMQLLLTGIVRVKT